MGGWDLGWDVCIHQVATSALCTLVAVATYLGELYDYDLY